MPVIAIGGVAIVAIAILAVIALYSTSVAGNLISKFGSYVPIIGNWLSNTSMKVWLWVIQSSYNSLQNCVSGLTIAIRAVWVAMNYIPLQIYNTDLALYHAIVWVKEVAIRRALNGAQSYAWNLYNQSLSRINTALSTAQAYAWNLYKQSLSRIAVALDTAQHYAAGLYGQALNRIAQALAVAENYSVALVANALNHVARMLSALEGRMNASLAALTDLVGQQVSRLRVEIADTATAVEHDAAAMVRAGEAEVVRAIDHAAAVTITGVWPGVITDVDALLKLIPEELSDIRDLVMRIPRTVPVDLTGVLEALGALSIPFLRYLVNCGAPMCVNLHNLTELFGELFDDVFDALFLAMIIEAVHNPKAVADELHSVVSPIANESMALFKDLVGM